MDLILEELKKFYINLEQEIYNNSNLSDREKEELLYMLKFYTSRIESIIITSFDSTDLMMNLSLIYNCYKIQWFVINNTIQNINFRGEIPANQLIYEGYLLSKLIQIVEKYLDNKHKDYLDKIISNYLDLLSGIKKIELLDKKDIVIDSDAIEFLFPKKIQIKIKK